MKICIVTTGFYLPQIAGGTESSINEICVEFKKRGYEVTIVSRLRPAGMFYYWNSLKSKISRRPVVYDFFNGFKVYRLWDIPAQFSLIPECKSFDSIFIQTTDFHLVADGLSKFCPNIAVYLRDISFTNNLVDCEHIESLKFIANSEYVSNEFFKKFSIQPPVVHPFVDRARYEVKSTGDFVTFVCPKKSKGLDIAKKLVELNPDIKFLFVESWPLSQSEHDDISSFTAKNHNVTYMPKTLDARTIYMQTKIALVPSIVPEGWGRVVIESQISGIPVIARACGGLIESTGTGGILMPVDADEASWSLELRKLYFDENYYSELSAKAKISSLRPKIQKEYIITKLIEYIQ